jgi:hypothetical protein
MHVKAAVCERPCQVRTRRAWVSRLASRASDELRRTVPRWRAHGRCHFREIGWAAGSEVLSIDCGNMAGVRARARPASLGDRHAAVTILSPPFRSAGTEATLTRPPGPALLNSPRSCPICAYLHQACHSSTGRRGKEKARRRPLSACERQRTQIPRVATKPDCRRDHTTWSEARGVARLQRPCEANKNCRASLDFAPSPHACQRWMNGGWLAHLSAHCRVEPGRAEIPATARGFRQSCDHDRGCTGLQTTLCTPASTRACYG